MKLRSNKVIHHHTPQANRSYTRSVDHGSVDHGSVDDRNYRDLLVSNIVEEERKKLLRKPVPFSKQFINAIAFPSTIQSLILYSCIGVLIYGCYLAAVYLFESVWAYPVELMFLGVCMLTLFKS